MTNLLPRHHASRRLTRSRWLAMAATAFALALPMATPATSQTVRPPLTVKATSGPFLTRLPSRFLMAPGDPRVPRVCRQSTSPIKCPLFLAYGGAADDLPTIDPAVKANLPHVRVTFVVQRIENDIVTDDTGGVDLGIFSWPWTWSTSSSAANVESTGSGFILPAPGELWQDNEVYLIRLYDALVFNECETFSGFPVDHYTALNTSDGSEVGFFHGVDNTTLNALGYYSFQFAVLVQGDGGRISNFKFSGKVSVTCSGLNALPQ